MTAARKTTGFYFDDALGRWVDGSKAATGRPVGRKRVSSGRYQFVTDCIRSTYEDIQALMASEQAVSRTAVARAIGPVAWRDWQRDMGYDKDFPISRDWHVGYFKGTFRGVPAYFIRHSRIEHIFTLDGKVGASLAAEGGKRAIANPDRRRAVRRKPKRRR